MASIQEQTVQFKLTLTAEIASGFTLAALVAGQGALAQTTAPSPASAPRPDAPASAARPGASAAALAASASSRADADLQSVVVTASKRPELAKDVPASIAVLSGYSLERQGADKLEDYVSRVPGLVLNAGAVGQQEITIRGLSTGPQGAPTVAVYIDDAPYGASTGDGAGGLLTPDIDSIDIERIEVLRGPQGTLYGASNIGGLLKYVTVAPDTRQFGGEFGIEGSSLAHGDEGHAVRGRINIPLVKDQFALLLSGYSRHDPGFIDDAGRGVRNVDKSTVEGGRLAALWKFSPALSIKAEAIGQDRHADGTTEVDVDPTSLQPLYGDYQQRRTPGADFFRSKMRELILTGTYDVDGMQLTSTSSVSTLVDFGGADNTQYFGPIASSFGPEFDASDIGFTATDHIHQHKFSQEVRLGRVGPVIDWTAGAYFTRETSTTLVGLPALDSLTGAPLNLPSLLDSDIATVYSEYAGFGELTFHATPDLDLIGGLRYARNKSSNTSTASGLLVGPESTTLGDSRDHSTTFSLSPRYRLGDNVTTYARIATGYRPGGANGGYGPNPTFKPDTVVNYELGVKVGIPKDKLSFDVALFDIDWNDIQLQLLDGNGLSYVANAGKARSTGLEFAAGWSPLPGLNLNASGAFTDATLTRDIPSGQYGVRGNSLPFSPRWKSSLGADYNFMVADHASFAGLSYFFTGSEQGSFAPDSTSARIRLPAYGTVDARTGVSIGQVDVTLFVKNIGDKRAYNGAVALTANPGGATAMSIIQPHTVGLSLKTDF